MLRSARLSICSEEAMELSQSSFNQLNSSKVAEEEEPLHIPDPSSSISSTVRRLTGSSTSSTHQGLASVPVLVTLHSSYLPCLSS